MVITTSDSVLRSSPPRGCPVTLYPSVVSDEGADAVRVRDLAAALAPFMSGHARLPADPTKVPLEAWLSSPDDRILRGLAVTMAREGRALWMYHAGWGRALETLVALGFGRAEADGVVWSPLLDTIARFGLHDEWQELFASRRRSAIPLYMALHNGDVVDLDRWLLPLAEWALQLGCTAADRDGLSWLLAFDSREIWRVVARNVGTLDPARIAFFWRSGPAAIALLENPVLAEADLVRLQRLALRGMLDGQLLPRPHASLSEAHHHTWRSMALALTQAAGREPGLAPDVAHELRGITTQEGALADAARGILMADLNLADAEVSRLLPRANIKELARLLAHPRCRSGLRAAILGRAAAEPAALRGLVRAFFDLAQRGPHIETVLDLLVAHVPQTYQDIWERLALHPGATPHLWRTMLASRPSTPVMAAIAAVPAARGHPEIRPALRRHRSAAVHRWLYRDMNPDDALRSWRIVADHDADEAEDLAERFPLPHGARADQRTMASLLTHDDYRIRQRAIGASGGVQIPGGQRHR